MQKKDVFVSLRRELPSVLWTGIRLRPEVDLQFRLRQFTERSYLLQVRLTREGALSMDFVTGCPFEMEEIGRDYKNLESDASRLAVASRHLSSIAASMQRDGGVFLQMTIGELEQQFRLYADEPDRVHFDRWEWFLDPVMTPDGGIPIYQACPVAKLFAQQAAD